MERFKRILVVLSAGCVLAVASLIVGTPAAAVPSHRHCMQTAQGSWVEVGPRVFEHPDLHASAFHEFHDHVHVGRSATVPPTVIAPLFSASLQCSSLNTP